MKSANDTAAILLASGFSKRFGGRNKLLISFRGKALARYTLELAAGFDYSGIYFVTAAEESAALAADFPGVKLIKNPSPEKGLRESVRLGVEAAGGAEYYLFFHCDMPFLDAATVSAVLEARQPRFIVEPRYKGRPGNPCLFSACYRKELLSLKEGETPRFIKMRRPEAIKAVEVSDPLILEDIDDEETLKRLAAAATDETPH